MAILMDRLKVEDGELNAELEKSYEDLDKMQTVFEKRIELYKRYLKEDTLNGIERVTLENKKEWTMSHLLISIEKKETDKNLQNSLNVYIDWRMQFN